ncbi:MAG: haloacid dehalogenase [Epsilonproteobacteria bacterium]|nr:MAG: haloacid dehalogenase [Campylobacterota bacterium]
MKPIYITDLDHTFLRSDLSISDFSANVWNEKAKDTIMSVATARSFQKSQELLKKLQINAPMILLDGAIIITPERKVITLKTIGKEIGDAIVDVGLQFDIDPFVIGVKDKELNEAFLYPRKLNDYQKNVLKGYKDDPRMQFNPDNRTMEQNLKIVYFGYETQLRPLYEEIVKIFGKTIEAKLSPEKYGGGYFLTLLHPEGDKAHALNKVMEYLKREPSDITVFGDSVNDIGMFKLAGTSVAVSNALDEVKAVADVVLPHSNDEDGVAKYLKALHGQ